VLFPIARDPLEPTDDRLLPATPPGRAEVCIEVEDEDEAAEELPPEDDEEAEPGYKSFFMAYPTSVCRDFVVSLRDGGMILSADYKLNGSFQYATTQ